MLLLSSCRCRLLWRSLLPLLLLLLLLLLSLLLLLLRLVCGS